jgi:catechol 2,3-dioxygenase-like lactoylglutathione lyase family enzyme
MIGIRGIHHVQVTVPRAQEAAALAFYRDVLGLRELPQPDLQAAQGGAWFAAGNAELHLKSEDISLEETRRSKRHVCLAVHDVDAAIAAFRGNGVEILPDERPIPGVKRCFVRDPGGNRIEITEA